MNLFDRPVFIGAHADDVELFAGGTLSRFSTRAMVMTFSFHKGVTNSAQAQREWGRSLKGIEKWHPKVPFSACDGSFLRRRAEIYEAIVEMLNAVRPSVVITHQSGDTNQDHRQVTEEVLRVCKKRCSILGGEFLDNVIGSIRRDVFVVLSEDDVKKKIEMLSCYRSQNVNGRTYLDKGQIVANAMSTGAMCGRRYAESFEGMRIFC